MKSGQLKNLSVLLAFGAAALIPSCADMDDATLTQVQGATIGGVLGGLAGGAAALLASDSDNRGEALLIGVTGGAAAGAAAGNQVGKNVAAKKQAYASQEQALQKAISIIDANIAACKNQNKELKSAISKAKREGGITRAERDRLQKKSKASVREIKSNISLINKELKKNPNSREAKILRARVAAWESQCEDLEDNTAELSMLRVRG